MGPGLSNIASEELANWRQTIIGISFLLGIGVLFLPLEVCGNLPELVRNLAGNGLLLGTTLVIILKQAWKKNSQQKNKRVRFQEGKVNIKDVITMENQTKIYDLIGIGIGPYNLGMAALLTKVPELTTAFFDENQTFEWHPGMLIEEMDLQVPFLADLTTFADPTSSFSYLNYLHQTNRLREFYFLERFKVPRLEYNDYLQWAAKQLNNLHFGYKVVDVRKDSTENTSHYVVITENIMGEKKAHAARHLVMGTGTKPAIPENMREFQDEDVFHTSKYLYKKEAVMDAGRITIIGSGQSAAEVFLDLLKEQGESNFHLTWLTRSEGIFQLENAKLGQEFFSPDYVDYFHGLSFEQRKNALDTLNNLRNGIDPETLKAIYVLLYHKSAGGREVPVTIQPLTEVKDISAQDDTYDLHCYQWQAEKSFHVQTDKVILATGYKPNLPSWFYARFANEIEWEDEKKYAVTRDYQLVFQQQERMNHFFVLTNLEHSHGAGATNLGLAVNRNVQIINLLAGRTVYEDKRSTIFQQFNIDK